VSKEGEGGDERSIMSQKISSVIHSVIISICNSTQSQNSHSTSDKSSNITFTQLETLVSCVTQHPPPHLGKDKFLVDWLGGC